MSVLLSRLKTLAFFRKEAKTSMRLSTVLLAVVVLMLAGSALGGVPSEEALQELIQNLPPGTYWDEDGGCLVHDPPIRLELPKSALLTEDEDTVFFDDGYMHYSEIWFDPPDHCALTRMPTPECLPGSVWILRAALLGCFNLPGIEPEQGTVAIHKHYFGESCLAVTPKGDSLGEMLGSEGFKGEPVDWGQMPKATWTQVDFDVPVPVLDSVFWLAWDYDLVPPIGGAWYVMGELHGGTKPEDKDRFFMHYGPPCPSSWEIGPWLTRAVGRCIAGTLNIVEDELTPSYCPPAQFWMDPDTVDVTFHVTAVLGHHRFVTFEATDLVHETRGEHKISASIIEFDPDMFNLIAHGETVEVAARIPVPVGALAGNYEGMFRARSQESGKEDSVSVVLRVGAVPDMDIDDNEGNLSGNVMHLEGLPEDPVNGTFVMLNPSTDIYNVDAFDGPGNTDLPDGSVTFTHLVSIDKSDTIPKTEMSLHDINEPGEDPLRAILSGTARHIGLDINIPSTAGAGTYEGFVTISFEVYSCNEGEIVTVSDVFGVSLVVGAVGGALAFVEGDELDTLSYDPPEQWVQDGFVIAQFTLTATGDVHNVGLYSDDLIHEGLPIKISGNSVNFSPGEIGVIHSGDTVEITARVPVPIGRRTGLYEGAFHAVADGGASANIVVFLDVNPVGDLDVQDYAGNLVANTMKLTGIAGGVVVGRYTVVNPNLPDNNVDFYDGPANDDITEITVVSTDLALERGGAEGKCKGVQLLCVQYHAGGGVEGKCKGVKKITFQYHNSGRGNLGNVKLVSKRVTYFMGAVSDGDLITADANAQGQVKFGADMDILVYDQLDERVHTSCSKPIEIGMVFGDWEIVDLEKITEGGGGGAPSPAFIEIKIKGVKYFSGMVEDGDTICVDARPQKFATDAEFYIEGYLNTKIHLSCSMPLEIGMQFGNFEVVDLIKVFEGTHESAISGANVDGNVYGITTIISGAAEDFLLQVTIPEKGIKHYDPQEDQTYKGTVTVQGKAVNANVAVSDEFNIELNIVKSGTRHLASGFWGEPGGSGNMLRWTGFGLNETGYVVYRALNSSYVKLGELSSTSRSFLDGETRSGLIYEYKLGLKIGGSEVMIGPISIKASDRLPGRSYLSQSFPNPTSGTTMFRFGVAAESHVSISIYNVAGQMVKVMVNEKKLPGIYAMNWDSSEYVNGVYFCRMHVGPTDGNGKPYFASRKVVVLR